MAEDDNKRPEQGGGGHKGGSGPKGPLWTPEKIKSLTDEAVKNLKANAEKRGNEAVSLMCQEVLQERYPKKLEPEGSHPKAKRTPLDREQEKLAVDLLLSIASELSTKYDLSAYPLLGKTGEPKVGGNQIKGLLNFNRYISYILNDELFSLLIWKSPELGGPYYSIGAPERYLKNPKPVESDPDLPLGPFIGQTKFSESFASFEETAAAYRNIIHIIAKAL